VARTPTSLVFTVRLGSPAVGLTSIQQKTLMEVIEQDGLQLHSQKVAQLVEKGPSSVQRAIGAPTEKELLRREQFEGGLRMRFEDPFFAQWIRAFPGKAAGM
jgi:hypothetical protein